MRNVLTIFLKELKRVFTDKRMLISLFLPGVLIYFVYTVMGTVMTKVVTQSSTKDTTFQVAYTDNFNSSKADGQLPKLMTYVDEAMKASKNNNTVTFKEFTTGELDSYKEELRRC